MFKKLFLIVCCVALLFTRANAACFTNEEINSDRIIDSKRSSGNIHDTLTDSTKNISSCLIADLRSVQMPSPQPRCISVSPTGNVTINWTVPEDISGTFYSYKIYSSTLLSGPYSLIDSIFTYSQSSYTHIGANANNVSVYYYIITSSGSGNLISPPVDTIRTMLLNVTNPGNGTAILNWNAIATPAISSSSSIYKVYDEFPSGVWNLTGTTSNLFLIDTIFICNAAINYKVELADNTGCTSVSSIDGGVFQNTIVPAIPQLDTISVDDNNNAVMNWNVSPSSDVEAYVIYKVTGGIGVPIDTVYGINNISFTYLLSNAGSGSEEYRLTAFDSCGNVSPLGTIYHTIHATATPDICAHSAILNWNAYLQSGSALAGYRIYQATAGATGPYTFIGSVAPSVTTFTASGLTLNLNYYFKVEAFDATGTRTASSNRYTFYSAAPIPPQFSYLRKVSVVDPNRVDITCHVDIAASTLAYKIMRSKDNISSNFVQIGTIVANNTDPILFSDNKVVTDNFSYYYKIINVDSCGFDGITTNVGRTILTHASGHTDYTNTITWNDYENWSGNVMSYNIYRGVDGIIDPVSIANVPYTGAGINFYSDDVSMILQGQGVFNYRVEAVEGMGNIYGFSESSFSNIADAYQEALVYIPNAFKPAGFNSVFIPVTTFVNITDYQFDVFNRWGLKVFSTSNIDEGWDGTNNGVKQGIGVYVYLLQFKTSRGEYIERKGTVTLIR